jgi:hypothetical protein
LHYCVAKASYLYEAVRQKLTGEGDTTAFCKALMETDGVLDIAALAKPPDEVEEKTR